MGDRYVSLMLKVVLKVRWASLDAKGINVIMLGVPAGQVNMLKT